jgi:hypothetical protein
MDVVFTMISRMDRPPFRSVRKSSSNARSSAIHPFRATAEATDRCRIWQGHPPPFLPSGQIYGFFSFPHRDGYALSIKPFQNVPSSIPLIKVIQIDFKYKIEIETLFSHRSSVEIMFMTPVHQLSATQFHIA